jgi:hypothetical protein
MADDDEFLNNPKFSIDKDDEFLNNPKFSSGASGGDIRSMILGGELPDQSAEDYISNMIGAGFHGAFDTATFGAGHKALDKALSAVGADPVFEKRRDQFLQVAPVSGGIGGVGGALITPGGKVLGEALSGGKTAIEASKVAARLAKTLGISIDAAQAALYNFNRAPEGHGAEEAGIGALTSLGLSGATAGLGKLVDKYKPGTKVMEFLFGLPEDIQNKIKANPDILKNVKTPEELQEKLLTSVRQLGRMAGESSEAASKKLSGSLQDYIPPEKLRSIVEGGQEELGNVKGLPLKEGAYRRLEQLKSQFPENKLFTPREVKPILQSLDQETGDYLRTSGAKSDVLKNVRRRIDEVLKENPEYAEQMKDTAQYTRLAKGIKDRFGIREMQDAETGIRELVPGASTLNILKGGEKTGRGDRLLDFLSGKTGSNIAEEVEKGRLANYLNQPRMVGQTGASLKIPAIASLAGMVAGGPSGAAAGAGIGTVLDKYGRRAGAELIGTGADAADYLQKNKLFKEFLSSQSPYNQKYAASHFIRSQRDPEYNKESQK